MEEETKKEKETGYVNLFLFFFSFPFLGGVEFGFFWLTFSFGKGGREIQ
jgi:hypothetical protein